MYRKLETDLVVDESIAIENREMELLGSKTLALIVLFDPDEGADLDVLFQVYDTKTQEYEGRESLHHIMLAIFIVLFSLTFCLCFPDLKDDTFALQNFTASPSFVNDLLVRLVYPQLTWFSPTSSRAWLLDTHFKSGVHSFRLLGKDDTGRFVNTSV